MSRTHFAPERTFGKLRYLDVAQTIWPNNITKLRISAMIRDLSGT
jgi:hypothetical protein